MTTSNAQMNILEPQTMQSEETLSETRYLGEMPTLKNHLDVSTNDQMNAVEASGAIDFWDNPQEDIYDESDGQAI